MSLDSRVLISEVSQLEQDCVRRLSDESWKLNSKEESILRWSLSLARVSTVLDSEGKPLDIGHASDAYRSKLFKLLSSCLNQKKIEDLIPAIYKLVRAEHRELLGLFGTRLKPKTLESAVEKRPLALALGGGGGTSFVFAGAFLALEEAGIFPGAISGSSMGAILGSYRAKSKHFDLEDLMRVAKPLVWSRITHSSEKGSRFGLPGTFRLNLHNVFESEFQKNGRVMHIGELALPFRVAVAGVRDSDIADLPGADWEEVEEMLAAELKKREKSIIQEIIQIARKPLKAIYLGEDSLTKEFDVLDAVGFSAAVPGLFHYDVMRDDSHMVPLIREVLHKHGVSRLVDGGFVDNLPAKQAKECLIDPFTLALDGFLPNWKKHWLFLPMMRIAAETSRAGHELADLSIAYQRVPSPINVFPSPKELERAVKNGYEETMPHIKFLKKILGPIPNPLN